MSRKDYTSKIGSQSIMPKEAKRGRSLRIIQVTLSAMFETGKMLLTGLSSFYFDVNAPTHCRMSFYRCTTVHRRYNRPIQIEEKLILGGSTESRFDASDPHIRLA